MRVRHSCAAKSSGGCPPVYPRKYPQRVTNSANNDIKSAVQEAAAIAASVPKELREAAFHRSLDALLGTQHEARTKSRTRQTSRRATGRRSSRDEPSDTSGTADTLIQSINRTAYPKLTASVAVLDRSLAVLRIAQDDFEIDGLRASEIAKVLTDKFRIRTTRQRVNQVLDSAGSMVDRIPGGRHGARYRLMAPGEKFLDAGGSESTDETAVKQVPIRGTRSGSPSRTRQRSQTAKKAGDRSRRKGSLRRSPKEALSV
jgi:hypothetical protein